MGIVLEKDQSDAVDKLSDWFLDERSNRFVLLGLAGTGKTTLINFFVDKLGLDRSSIAFAAYTGKAAMVLRSKGIHASTIHRLIYEPVIIGKTIEFKKKRELSSTIRLIFIDECSMVSDNIRNDLESFNIPIVYIGDHGQLPPIVKDGAVNIVMANPDIVLEKIHRQALDNPIIYLSMLARSSQFIQYGKYGDKVVKVSRSEISDEFVSSAPQILCGKNATRIHINDVCRQDRGYINPGPVYGDRLICTKNNWHLGLINGMTGELQSVPMLYAEAKTPYYKKFDFVSDEGDSWEDLKVDATTFNKEKTEFVRDISKKNLDNFDFGYAITVHKAQGSQYEAVLLMEERMGDSEFHARWLYTGITRAINRLIIVA